MKAKVVPWFVCLCVSTAAALGSDDSSAGDGSRPSQVASVAGPPVSDPVELERVARDGDTSAQFRLGMHYFHGDGVPRDVEAAEKWLRLAGAAGHSDARRVLVAMHNERLALEFESVRARAVRGDAQAQFQIGKWYQQGRGPIAADVSEAVNWLRKAAEQNHAEAEYELGLVYRDGVGVERNEETAARWIERAAGRGLLRAKVALRDQAREEQGVTIDPVNAFRVATNVPFYQAATAGDANAQYELGLMYFNGDAVARDYKQGVYWLSKAAEQDHVNAQLFLADVYVRGTEIDGDYAAAVAWYARAARLDNAEAQYMLANLYRMGLGVKADAEAAKRWYAAAARQGHPKAKQRLAEAGANVP